MGNLWFILVEKNISSHLFRWEDLWGSCGDFDGALCDISRFDELRDILMQPMLAI